MDVKFDFEDVGKGSFGRIWRPIAKVTLSSITADKRVTIWMIVDTGADYTIIPRHFSQKLRISFERDCVKELTFGIGGQQTVYFLKSKIQAKIGQLEREIPLAFFDTNEVPALLGRLGFLETFETIFEKQRRVIFKE